MKLLSVDIGLRNLAMCILDCGQSDIQIVRWDVVDLLPPAACHKCTSARAVYALGDMLYCRKCANDDPSVVLPTPALLDACKPPYNWELMYKRGLVFRDCKQSAASVKRATATRLLKVYKHRPAASVPLQEVASALDSKFEEFSRGHKFDLVAIENQIGPQAIRMKAVQAMLTQLIVSGGWTRGWDRIVYVSAKDKLKECAGTKGKDYEGRKKLAVNICIALLENSPAVAHWFQAFNAHPKKDDLADAYLQGVVVAKSKGHSPPARWKDVMARIT